MSSKPNSQYNVASAGSLPVRIAGYQRRRMFDRFMHDTGVAQDDLVLDIGTTSERSYPSSNYFEKWFPFKENITAAGLDDAGFLEQEYPGLRFVKADACDLPFEDDSFDYVHSSAVIEHVGSAANQARMIAECARVARKGFFITTPNRWFPVEFHTVTPLLHWLPPRSFRSIMRGTGRAFFADERNLNLMTRSSLAGAANEAGIGKKFRCEVGSVALARWPSNLLLIGKKPEPA